MGQVWACQVDLHHNGVIVCVCRCLARLQIDIPQQRLARSERLQLQPLWACLQHKVLLCVCCAAALPLCVCELAVITQMCHTFACQLTTNISDCACNCRLTVPNREWPGLLEWLHQLSSSPSEHSRQAALHILSALTEVIGAHPQWIMASNLVLGYMLCAVNALDVSNP